jgi:Zinc-binding
MCVLCRQTFMVNARKYTVPAIVAIICLQTFMISLCLNLIVLSLIGPPLLMQHVTAKHPPGTDPLACFPEQLKDYDPNDPNGEKKAAAEAAAGTAVVKPKKVVKKDDDLDLLLDAGLKSRKK